jgi:hypothetical protein
MGNKIKNTANVLAEYPKSAAAMLKVSAHEAKAKKNRSHWLDAGVSLPQCSRRNAESAYHGFVE